MSDKVSPAEVWKAIPGYEGFYSVSDLGRVRRDRANNGCKVKIIKPRGRPNDYLHVSLCANGKVTQIRVHRLVLETFLGIDPNKPQTNHKNGIRGDNRLVNLEWVTCGENIRHSFQVLHRPALIGSDVGNSKINEESVRKIRFLISCGVIYKDIAAEFGISRTAVSDIFRGRTWKHVT
jgi:hypothetical protein